LDDDLIEAAVDRSRPFELPPADHVYKVFADPSGGRSDRFSICVAHREGDQVVVDVLRDRKPPFDPHVVTAEFAELAKAYGCHTIVGDRYSAEWCSMAFRGCGVSYEAAGRSKSDLYLEVLPMFARGVVRFPAHKRLISELRALERRPGRSGKDSVDHPVGGSDDVANSVAGALWLLAEMPMELTSDMLEVIGGGVMAKVRDRMDAWAVDARTAMMVTPTATPPWDRVY
jgi:hypothetical protein